MCSDSHHTNNNYADHSDYRSVLIIHGYIFTSRGRSEVVWSFVSGFLSAAFKIVLYSGGSKTVENVSNAEMELWLSALNPGWRLLAALLSQFSHNHPE